MDNLERSGLVPLLDERVRAAGVPVLGICLGMQLMTRSSSEGERRGLGWVDARTLRFAPADPTLKVPHMGWNVVRARSAPSRSSTSCQREPRFYFVHSYHVVCDAARRRPAARRDYGCEFDSAFEHGNVWGVQFHPEKSHKFGMQLLRNFAERC